jgi:hypothetical protein
MCTPYLLSPWQLLQDAEKTVEVVKTECTELVQQMQQGKVDSVDHVHALQGKMKEIIQVQYM